MLTARPAPENKSIVETKRIQDILDLVIRLHKDENFHHKNIWLLLDFDNNLMKTKSVVGGDAWFNNLIGVAKSAIADEKLAIESAICLYHLMQHYVIAESIEDKTHMMIDILQKLGINVTIITARDECLENPTFRQADTGKFDPSINHDNQVHSFGTHPKNTGYYKGGIIFCSGNPKGDCLEAFFAKCAALPDIIIMADDKKAHLESVQKIAAEHDKVFHGFHYTRLDDEVKQFDMKEANQQMLSIAHTLDTQIQQKISEAEKQLKTLKSTSDLLKHLCPEDKRRETKEHAHLFEPNPHRPSLKRKFNAATTSSRFFQALDLTEPPLNSTELRAKRIKKSAIEFKADAQQQPSTILKF